MMHHIQAKILQKLLYAKILSYAALRPDGVESNHFAYHLNQLLHSKLVAKLDKGYSLAPGGLVVVDRLSHTNMRPRVQPHIATAIHVTNDAGKTLLFKRHFQPYIDRWGLPLGKIHLEETVDQAAARELYEKTGLQNVELGQRGIMYAETLQEDKVISKILAHVFSGVVSGEPPLLHDERGSCRWGDPAQLPPDERIPWLPQVLELLGNTPRTRLFFKEVSVPL